VRGRRPADFWIYRFRITSSGRATRPAAVSGGLITGQKYLGNVGGFVVSPDGSRLALAVASTAANAVQSGLATEILVIDLRTGAHATWRGGMDRPGELFGVQNLSWTRGGEALAYQGQWRRLAEVGYGMDTGYTCVKWSSQVASRYDGTDVVREISVTPGDRTGRYVLAWMTGSANGRQLHGWVQGGAYHRLAPAPTLYGATLQMTW